MFNDIDLERKYNEGSFALTSRKIKEYASNFNDGHWAFLGPGEESKWYQGYATDCGRKWDLRASQMVEDFENSGHRVFQGVSPLGLAILKKNNNRDTIPFNGEHCNVDLLYRTTHSATQLCIYGAVTKWCGTNSGETRQSRLGSARHLQKFKSSRRISSHWLIFQDYRMLRETECFRMWKFSIRCHLWAWLNISAQRGNSTIQSRKEIIMLQLLLKMTDGENARQCAKNTQRQEIGRIQGLLHQLMQNKKLVLS